MKSAELDSVLIIGCGWVGTKLATTLISQNINVFGTTRSSEKASSLRSLGIVPIIFDLEKGLGEDTDYTISGIKFEIKGKGKRVSKYTKNKISIKLKLNTGSGEKEFYTYPSTLNYVDDYDDFMKSVSRKEGMEANWDNDESFSCYFEKKIEFGVDKGHPSQDLMFKINFTIKESDRHIADFDPIAEELWTYYKKYTKNLKKSSFQDEGMLNRIDNELNLPKNRRFHTERLKEKQSQFHYCLALTYFLAGKLDRVGDHWEKWQYSTKKSNIQLTKYYSIDLCDQKIDWYNE